MTIKFTKVGLRAHKSSIAHWRRFEEGKAKPNERPVGQDCALCKVYRDNACGGCPVAQAGHPTCSGTPYMDAYRAFQQVGVNGEEFKRASKLERVFLEYLLPEPEPKKLPRSASRSIQAFDKVWGVYKTAAIKYLEAAKDPAVSNGVKTLLGNKAKAAFDKAMETIYGTTT